MEYCSQEFFYFLSLMQLGDRVSQRIIHVGGRDITDFPKGGNVINLNQPIQFDIPTSRGKRR